MPKRSDLKKVLIIGSGPIVIGQACEFDYSGTQACKALMQEGLEVVLVNSNPATIMTDPESATKVYIEPLNLTYLEKIIEKEKPDAVIPTLGGQTALNLALELFEQGVLEKHRVELLGASPTVIRAAEDREIFRGILDKVGAKYPKSYLVKSFDEGMNKAAELGYPLVLRPNYTLGGGGGGIAYTPLDFQRMLIIALNESPTSEVLVEASILGWKEFELEVMRDKSGTFVVICSIENFDPCGVHTGDSITVAPQQTLSDREYQAMRDEAYKILEEVGIQTGGANIQFAVHPETGERVVIEMNPRVSRSSALASKATGFPIAKIAALLSIGYDLEEIKNDITGTTPACYEPALDYVVTKIPRFAFEKFPGAKDLLGTQMKSVGEVMGIGRTFQESFMKAILSLEKSDLGFPFMHYSLDRISYPNSQRIFHIYQAFREGLSVDEMASLTQIHPWFLEQVKGLADFESQIKVKPLDAQLLLEAKRKGFSDALIAALKSTEVKVVQSERAKHGILPCYFQVDTCAGEFASFTPYFYSTYWYQRGLRKNSLAELIESDLRFKERQEKRQKKTGKAVRNEGIVALIGSGPNRIGQGIEFDYSCVRGVRAFQSLGYRVAMINSNPETVSTDYDTGDYLFFEPLTQESVSEILRFLNPFGFVSQLGGQTPIHLAPFLVESGFNLLGSTLDSIDLAEDRSRFNAICRSLDFQIPDHGMAEDFLAAKEIALKIGFPVIVRPSYVLGGRRMEVIESLEELDSYFNRNGVYFSKASPCLIDQFLSGALEVDVDLVRGPDWQVIGGVVEHIEAAGVHSGDSQGVLPPQRLKDDTLALIEQLSMALADKLGIIGHLNLQLAIKQDRIFILEANPRSSRSVPFIVKATGIPLVHLGVMAMLGFTNDRVKAESYDWKRRQVVSVKGVVFPFKKFSEADSILGPEMKSTGESMGRGSSYAEALMKAMLSSHIRFPKKGEVFFSLREKDKPEMLGLAKELIDMGYTLSATRGTAQYFRGAGLPCIELKKVHEGRPHCVDHIRQAQVCLVINTTSGRVSIDASFAIRRACIDFNIPCLTESDAAVAFVLALKQKNKNDYSVSPLPANEEVRDADFLSRS